MRSERYHIVLASNSPRRRELLSGLDLEYEVKVLPDIEEGYPEGLSMEEIPRYIAAEKAAAYKDIMADNDLIITADTVVVLGDEVLGKPAGLDDARRMLRELSGKTHQVITGVYLMTKEKERGFSVVTDVTFKELSDEEIDYYVEKYRPLDKAGAYGIQEWIGYIGVTGLNGSYFNVMGLPVQRIYNELLLF
ncbi:MAG: septum formation protein Maf [Prevotella sp.]|nr:septum formation protein Maf [Prevotella sp.]